MMYFTSEKTARRLEAEEKRTRRNLNPHAEAVFAMCFYGKRYSEQHGGSMDFWDRLLSNEKKFCTEQVKRIKTTRSKHSSFHGKVTK